MVTLLLFKERRVKEMKKNTWIDKLKEQEACEEAIDWASEQESAQAAWSACERGDWMLWAWGENCGKIGSKSHRFLVLACVECARTSLKYNKDKESKRLAKKSLETTERWARGEKEVTLEDVENVWYAAAGDAGAVAVNAATSIAVNPGASSDAAHYASDAAHYAAGAAARAAGYAAAREKALKKCADIIRKIQPLCPKFKRVTE